MGFKYITTLLSSEKIAQAALLLKEGHLVAFPTETVYGLGALAFNEEMVSKIFEVKGRPSDNPLIVHMSRLEQIQELALEIPPFFEELTTAFFPGPLTLVLKRHPKVSSIVSGGLDTIAVRIPKHPLAIALIEAVGQPLVAPSANRSGRPSSTEAIHVLDDFSGEIAAVIDGGACEHGIESTVVSLLEEKPILLRPGAITLESLEALLKQKIEKGSAKHKGSPGMKYRHYAPRIPVYVFSEEKKLKSYLHPKAFVLKPKSMHLEHETVFDLEAKNLYAQFRYAEKMGFSEIFIYYDASLDFALANRIFRAADLKEMEKL